MIAIAVCVAVRIQKPTCTTTELTLAPITTYDAQMLVRDGPEAGGGGDRHPFPFDARIVHYVTQDGRYCAWTLELDPVPTTPFHASRALAASLAAFAGVVPEAAPPALRLPADVAAALGAEAAAGAAVGGKEGVGEAKRGGGGAGK